MKSYLKFLLAFIGGVGVGFLIVSVLPYVQLAVSNPLFSTVGIQKPRIIAFLPYFLASKETNNNYLYITTLDYFGFTLDSDGHILKLANAQQEDPGWYDLRTPLIQKKLQDARHNHITLSLSVIQQDEASISALLSNPKKHAQNLLSDIIPVIKKYGFTDVNIDVESFQKRDVKDIQAFTTFVQTIKNGLDKEHIATVTLDIPPIAFVKTNLINPIAVGKVVDYMVVMAYDYSNVVSPNTGPIAPLNGIGEEREFDVSTAISLAKKEVNPQKIILGVPLYGYEWDSLSSTPAAAAIPNTGVTASNKRIMKTFSIGCTTCTVVQDSVAEEADFIYQDKGTDPYYHHARLFDVNAMSGRISFAEKNQLAGVALWALGYEGDTLLQPLALYKGAFHFK